MPNGINPATAQSFMTRYPSYQPGFGENFASIATAFLQGKQQKQLAQQEAIQKAFAGIAPTWASRGMIRPGGQTKIGDVTYPMTFGPYQPEPSEVLTGLRTEELEMELGKRVPTDAYLRSKAVTEANKNFFSGNMMQQLMAAEQAGLTPDQYRQQMATQIYNDLKTAYTPTKEIISPDITPKKPVKATKSLPDKPLTRKVLSGPRKGQTGYLATDGNYYTQDSF